MSRSALGILGVVGVVLAGVVVVAGAEPTQAPPPRVIPVADLVKQLGSEDFAERDAATRRLGAMVLDPPPELLAAAKSDNPEVRDRAAKVIQAMRSNVVATRLPRGQRFAEQGRADLFVAATAVWDLRPEDPRLWEPAVDLGRRLIEQADMTGDRKPHNCPSSFKDYDTYKRLLVPRFTRVDGPYERPDPQQQKPPRLFINEAIHAAGVSGSTGITYNLIVSRGSVETQTAIQASVVFANGDVTARNGLMASVIVCDGDVTVTDSHIWTTLVIARGNITVKGQVDRGVLLAGGKVTVEGGPPKVTGRNYSVVKEDQANPLGITFFELATVGVEATLLDKVRVSAVADGKPFARAGVKVGDIIAEVNGKKPDTPESLRRLLRDALAVGDATVKLQRGDKTETVKITLPE
jgi:hypothetical protein